MMKRGMDQGLQPSFTASHLPVRSLCLWRMAGPAGLAVSVFMLMSQFTCVQAQPKHTVATPATLQEAAQRAGFMLLQANGHYGTQVRRDVDRARTLITQAARADHVAAGFMLNMLESTD